MENMFQEEETDNKELHKKVSKIISYNNEYLHVNKTGSMMKTDPRGMCLCTQG